MMSGVMCQVRLPRLLKPCSVLFRLMPKPQPPFAVTGPIGQVEATECRAVELRALLELIVVEVARAAGQRQYLRDHVEVDRGEKRGLPVAALHVLAERRVGVLTQAGIVRIGAGQRSDGR